MLVFINKKAMSESVVQIYSSMKKSVDEQIFFYQCLLEENKMIHENIYYELVNNKDFQYNTIIDTFKQVNNNQSIMDKLNDLVKLKEFLEQKIRAECKHEYEDDMIDLTYETSKKITYCKKCMSTF
jgi:hypothetical protein